MIQPKSLKGLERLELRFSLTTVKVTMPGVLDKLVLLPVVGKTGKAAGKSV